MKRKFECSNAPKGVQLAAYFFDTDAAVTVDGKKKNSCKSCNKLVVNSRGATNLCDHIKSKHENWLEIINDHEEATVNAGKKITSHYNPVGLMTTFAPSDKAKTINSHLKFIIGTNQGFEVVNHQYFKAMVKSEPYVARTMKNWALALHQHLVAVVTQLLPDRFILAFDGWDNGHSSHLVALYAVIPNKDEKEVLEGKINRWIFLRCTSMGSGAYQDANTHYTYINETLQIFGKTIDNVYFFLADNTNTNPRIARLFGKVSIGCHSHRLNIAVKELLTRFDPLLNKLSALMNKFKNVKLANLLTKKQQEFGKKALKAVSRNATRWTSTFEMLKRFKKIQCEMSMVIHENPALFGDENGNEMDLVTPSETVRLNTLSEDLEIIHQTTVLIQKSSFHYVGVKDALRLLAKNFKDELSFLEKIGPSSNMVMDSVFESGLYKLMQGNALLPEEKAKLEVFKKRQIQEDAAQGLDHAPLPDLNITDAILACNINLRENQLRHSTSVYDDVTWIPATTCPIERLFSIAKHILTQDRSRLSKELFNCILFLREHMNLWDIHGYTMQTVMTNRKIIVSTLSGKDAVTDADLFTDTAVDDEDFVFDDIEPMIVEDLSAVTD
jgi:hypothetical protein